MQNTERQKFEENWKDAFDGAEATPPDGVWNSIELDLAGHESVVMKKKVVFYQRLAAAMVVFALLAGTYAFYTSTNEARGTRHEQSATNEKPSVKTKEKDNGNSSVKMKAQKRIL
ncbi:MAG: hypothetical protein WDO15_17565 [Bacteroidota bacterium]